MNSQSDLLNEWYRRVAVTQYAHYLSANQYGALKLCLGVPAIFLAAVVGTSVFATIEKQPDLWIRVCVGLASVGAAVLTSLQTFLGYAERAEKHRVAGAKYGALGRELEQLRTSKQEHPPEAIADLRRRIDDLAIEAPNNPLRIYRQAGGKDIDVVRN
jgi:hypothetical protein